jgi:hypothetical protein
VRGPLIKPVHPLLAVGGPYNLPVLWPTVLGSCSGLLREGDHSPGATPESCCLRCLRYMQQCNKKDKTSIVILLIVWLYTGPESKTHINKLH